MIDGAIGQACGTQQPAETRFILKGEGADCASKLDKFVQEAPYSTVTTIDLLAESTAIVPYAHFAPGTTFFQAGLVDRNSPQASWSVQYFFGPGSAPNGGSALIAAASRVIGEVVLGDSYISSTDTAWQAAVLIHELLHIADRSQTHEQLADKFGVQYDKNAANPEGAAAEALTEWIKGGCKSSS